MWAAGRRDLPEQNPLQYRDVLKAWWLDETAPQGCMSSACSLEVVENAYDRSRLLISPGSSPTSNHSDDGTDAQQGMPGMSPADGAIGLSRHSISSQLLNSQLGRTASLPLAALHATSALAEIQLDSSISRGTSSGVTEALQRYDSSMPAGLTRGRSGLPGSLARQASQAGAGDWSAVNDVLEQGMTIESQRSRSHR